MHEIVLYINPNIDFRIFIDLVVLAGLKMVQSVLISRNKGLAEQDLTKLDVTKLHPLFPEVISRQATINIGKLHSAFASSSRSIV